MDFLVHHMLQKSATHLPDKEALVHGSERLSYREVAQRVAGLAQGLRNAGVRRCDRVGVYLEPSVAQVISIFGISQAGGAFVPINAVLLSDQVAHIVRDCAMKALITTPAKLADLLEVLPDLPSLQFIVLTGDALPANPPRPVHRFDALCATPHAASQREIGISKDLAAILYTSGSTGRPKGVAIPQRGVSRLLLGTNYVRLGPGDRIAQLIIAPVVRAEVVEVDELAPTTRGPGGFGHTGR